jgi:hypothetical protein
VATGKNEKVANSASAVLFILLLAQNALLGMDTFSTPWIANLTEESVEFNLTDSRNVAGSFQLRPGTILQYTVGPQEIVAFSLTRASGQVQSYDQATPKDFVREQVRQEIISLFCLIPWNLFPKRSSNRG